MSNHATVVHGFSKKTRDEKLEMISALIESSENPQEIFKSFHHADPFIQELIEELVEKGELTIEQGKVLNEELKHNVKETMEGVKKTKKDVASNSEDMMEDLEKMSAEELEVLEEKIKAMKNQKSEESDQGEVIR